VQVYGCQLFSRYLGKISGPLWDRIDLHIEVPAVAYQEMRSKTPGASSAEMRARVLRGAGSASGPRIRQSRDSAVSGCESLCPLDEAR